MTHIPNLSKAGHRVMYLQQVQLHLAALAVELDISLPAHDQIVVGKPGSTGRDAQEIEYISESLALIVAAVAAL
jgi:hypothetical protein